MAIPIGGAQKNYGLIKVVNSLGKCSWFTDYDQGIGENLAKILHRVIEKFLYFERMQAATDEAKKQTAKATVAQRNAEKTAEKRKEDLMIITHQLQGPLASVIGSLSALDDWELPGPLRTRLSRVQDLVEDSIDLAFGTFAAFALDVQRRTSFGTDRINVRVELDKLCTRLQATNARADLRFQYSEEVDFPEVTMDRNVFTSVMYSLVHNAMKYSDHGGAVILECSREFRSAAVKVKTTGEPIDPSERELIFEKFMRGRAVDRGRHHLGVGLGLWVARMLMRAIGGDLTLELSPRNPRFSVFVVHIPPSRG